MLQIVLFDSAVQQIINQLVASKIDVFFCVIFVKIRTKYAQLRSFLACLLFPSLVFGVKMGFGGFL